MGLLSLGMETGLKEGKQFKVAILCLIQLIVCSILPIAECLLGIYKMKNIDLVY